MKFLLDQNLSPKTVLFLRKLGVSVVDVREVGLAGKSDDEIYEYALRESFVLVTFDHEFGYKCVARGDLQGLIIIRLHPQTLELIHSMLERFFSTFDLNKVKHSIVVIEKHRLRIRKIRNGN